MADNPYTKSTLTGYDANAPTDDGSQTPANEIAWDKHTSKLGDPLKNFSESQNDNTSDAFAKTINTDADQNNAVAGSVAFTSSELTIVTGSVAAVRSHHTIDTETDAATDDLDTITVAGVSDGCLLFLRLANAARVVTLKHNADNLKLKDDLDIVLDANFPAVLQRIGANWQEIERPNRLNRPSFLATNSASDASVTGDGTVYTVLYDNEVFDQGGNFVPGTGIFTAPVAGKYQFNVSVRLSGTTTVTGLQLNLITSNRTYITEKTIVAGTITGDTLTLSVLADMDASDTVSTTVVGSGGSKAVNVVGGANGTTAFSGFLT